jgi:class 3 adenylate cyclase/HAMP domain-containing protein
MVYEVGFDYLSFRSIIHDTGLMLVYVMVGSALFVIILFPYFFKESLVKPLGQLLDGVKKVNQGDLRVSVPVKVEDEIGFLSKSFNSMVQSIQKARTDLRGALDHQVQLTDSYSCFVPKEFLQFLEKDSIIDINLGDNVQKEMSILFSDIRSFTRLSESMTPQENFNFINNCLRFMGPVVRRYNGFIDKYIGDAIMALFPHRTEDAVQAAIGMQNELKTYNSYRKKSGYAPIQIGIGINTGDMMLGTIGEEKRMEGTVISDAVNLASRLEGLTKIYGASIIASRNTINGIEMQTDFYSRFLDKVQVKGKEKWIEVYEIFDSDPESRVEMKLKTKEVFERGIRLFQKKMFDEALDCFKRVADLNKDDEACLLYMNRCEHLKEYGIPKGWDGVTEIGHKR